MLRITHKGTTAAGSVYALAGEITAEQLPRLEALVQACAAAGRGLTLDLSWVWRADGEMVAFLTTGTGRAISLVGLPEGLAEWLRDESGEGRR